MLVSDQTLFKGTGWLLAAETSNRFAVNIRWSGVYGARRYATRRSELER